MGESVRLGVIGLGNIGKPSALRLLGAEPAFTVYVYDIFAEAVQELVEAGATASASVAALAADCEPSSPSVKSLQTRTPSAWTSAGLPLGSRPEFGAGASSS